jgi:hypothetical protein
MTKTSALLLLCSALLCAGAPIRAEVAADAAASAPGELQLPPKIRKALIDEMSALQPALSRLAEAIPQGDWELIAKTAEAMRDGFILKQALTSTELASLRDALPERFLLMDTEFHQQADKLATAARAQDRELVPFYFYKMTETCMTCHSAYAGTRFPGYRPAPDPHHHHH